MANDNPTIEYRDVPDFPGYRVGVDGTVWTCWSKNPYNRQLTSTYRQLKGGNDAKGYPRVALYRPTQKEKKYIQIHRLVLNAFVGSCPEGMECRHVNGIKTDNRLENLCWGTPEENQEDNRRLDVYSKGEENPTSKLTAEQVREIRRRYEAGGVFQRELAAEFGVTVPHINVIIHRKRWKHLG